jgi:hypothetical protein
MTFKKLNPKESIFYVLELSTTEFAIYDNNFDVPIYYGKWNMVEGIMKSIKEHNKNSSIYYYIKEKNGPMKLDPQWSYNI